MAQKQVNLEIITQHCYYNQNPQTSEIQWAFLNRIPGEKDSFKELHLQVKCREYFGDAVVCAHLDIDTPAIYGFRLVNKRVSIEETLLSVSLPSNESLGFIKHLSILRKFERQMGIKITKCYSTQHTDEDSVKLVLVGDKKWVSSPLLIAIYTQILRSFTYHTPTSSYSAHIKALITEYSGNDRDTFSNIHYSGIDLLHLLLNIDRVLGDNPLTGLNDLELKAKKASITDENSRVLLYSLVVNETNFTFNWSVHLNHSRHGINSFIDNMNYRGQGGQDAEYVKKSIGASWTNNYYLLCKEEQEEALSSCA